MKLHDLFNIIIKVFGLFIIKDILFQLPYLVSLLTVGAGFGKIDTDSLIIVLLIIALYFAIGYALIFKTESIIKMLKLEPQLSDEYLSFNVSSANVLNIALIIMAGYILIDMVPVFCNTLYNYYEQVHERFSMTSPSLSGLLLPAVKIVIALLIIGERKRIVALVEKKPVSQDEFEEETPGEDFTEES